ncbi:MAG: hypothetical protein D6719_08535 [Candidatus Dadabacteria bacterium]|nr:MAG: hypothetical protein D6719_08535 [Candidatus Dadabacteria bacterium]
MAKKKKTENSEAIKTREAQLAYEREIKQKQIRNAVGWSLVSLITLFLLVIVATGDQYGVLKIFGISLYNEEAGVYADCSKAINKNNAYCRPKRSRADAEWSALKHSRGKTTPFTLHGK